MTAPVLSKRRFFVPDKKNAKHFTGTKKCAGTKTHEGTCADWVFVEAEPPKGGVAFAVC